MDYLFWALLLIAVAIYWAKCPMRPSNQYVKHRKIIKDIWSTNYPENEKLVVEILESIKIAFLLKKDDIYKLRPTDKLSEIYEAAYPSKGVADALEFETLYTEMKEKGILSEMQLANLYSLSIGQLIELARENA